jgi:prevent-host-death family protein
MTKSAQNASASSGSGVVRVGVHEAKTRLSQLLRLVDAGQEVEIFRGDEPVAKLVPIRTRQRRQLGVDDGVFKVPNDFDDPLPSEILEAFWS